MSGTTLVTEQLQPDESLANLARKAAVVLGSLHCKLVSKDGRNLVLTTTMERNTLRHGDVVTAMAIGRAPLLVSSKIGSAMVLVKAGGTAITWGHAYRGGDSSCVREQLSSDVLQVTVSESAVAALKADGSVVTWGCADE